MGGEVKLVVGVGECNQDIKFQFVHNTCIDYFIFYPRTHTISIGTSIIWMAFT